MHLPNGKLVAKQSTAFATHLNAKHLVLIDSLSNSLSEDPLLPRSVRYEANIIFLKSQNTPFDQMVRSWAHFRLNRTTVCLKAASGQDGVAVWTG